MISMKGHALVITMVATVWALISPAEVSSPCAQFQEGEKRFLVLPKVKPNVPFIRDRRPLHEKGRDVPLYLVQEQSGGKLTGLQRVGQFLLENTRAFLERTQRPGSLSREMESCFTCHPNGHTDGSFVPAPDGSGLRYDTPSLRGVAYTAPLAFKRQISSLETFIFTEIRAAHVGFFTPFNPDSSLPSLNVDNVLRIAHEGGGPSFAQEELDAMAAFLRALDFPPNDRLDLYGRLERRIATPEEIRGEILFHGAARCLTCHPPPFYTDLQAYNLKQPGEYPPSGMINVPTLRGIRFSPPYFHDGRFDGQQGRFPDDLTIHHIDVDRALTEVVEFFDLLLDLRLGRNDIADLVAFLKTL